MTIFFSLDENKNPVPCSLEEYKSCQVARNVIDEFEISTIFIGINHNLFGGAPILFETMIFKNNNSLDFQERYDSWDKALEGHKKAVDWVKNGFPEK